MTDKPTPTTLIDIYEAAGLEVSEDRQSVIMPRGYSMKPFDIVLKVFPGQLEWDGNGNDRMTFRVLLSDDWHIARESGALRVYSYSEEVTLPIPQVRILKED